MFYDRLKTTGITSRLKFWQGNPEITFPAALCTPMGRGSTQDLASAAEQVGDYSSRAHKER
jgi:hypothetical protein